MAGITNSGFNRKTLTEILESLSANAKQQFGQDFNTDDDSVFKQLSGPFSIELDEIWQQTEAAYSAYTQAGAEGVHLDNFYAFRGVGRLDSAPSTDNLMVGTDDNLADPFTLTNTRFTSPFDVTYEQTNGTDTIGVDNTRAYRILVDDLQNNTTYQVSIADSSGTTQTVGVGVTDDASKIPALNAIRTHIITHRSDITGNIFIDSTGLYVGYSSATEFNITASTFNLSLDPFAGRRYSLVPIRSLERGVQSGEDESIYTINPTFTGFVEAQGGGSFFVGRNVETDAEYRLRAQTVINTTGSSSADSIINRIVSQTNATEVVVFENPTDAPTTEVPQSYAIHIIVFGGTPADIGQAIFDTVPLNISMFGSTAVQVPNNSGTNTTVRYSPVDEVSLTFRLDYDTTDDSLLTTEEQTLIQNAVVNYTNNLNIGGDLQIFPLQSIIVTALPAGRLSALTVNVRETISGSFQTTDYVADFDEILRTLQGNINFLKV